MLWACKRGLQLEGSVVSPEVFQRDVGVRVSRDLVPLHWRVQIAVDRYSQELRARDSTLLKRTSLSSSPLTGSVTVLSHFKPIDFASAATGSRAPT